MYTANLPSRTGLSLKYNFTRPGNPDGIGIVGGRYSSTTARTPYATMSDYYIAAPKHSGIYSVYYYYASLALTIAIARESNYVCMHKCMAEIARLILRE